MKERKNTDTKRWEAVVSVHRAEPAILEVPTLQAHHHLTCSVVSHFSLFLFPILIRTSHLFSDAEPKNHDYWFSCVQLRSFMKVEVWTDLFPSLRNWRNVTPKPVIFHNVRTCFTAYALFLCWYFCLWWT